jgi:hypothetical protein
MSAGVFGVPLGFVVIALGTWMIPKRWVDPAAQIQVLATEARDAYPGL